tara:strand:- start:7057 stop:7392 length:336 start_codon:yes stop_codon:yes gene_type:complete
MATSYDINLTAGDDFYHRFAATGSDGLPISLAPYSISGRARSTYGASGVLLDLSPTAVATGIASGYIDVTINGESTTGLASTQGVYNIQLHSGESRVRVFRGFLNINPSIR